MTPVSKPSPWIASALSVLPGVGQIYAGRWKRGVGLMLTLLAQTLTLKVAGAQAALPWLVVIWLWNMADAWRIAAGRPSSLVVPATVLAALNLIIGAQSSEIGGQLRQLDPATGLAQARNLTAALARPDMLQVYDLQTADADLSVSLSRRRQALAAEQGGPTLLLRVTDKRPGAWVYAIGRGFAPRAAGQLYLRSGGDKKLADFTTGPKGGFTVRFRNPIVIPGNYWIEAEVRRPVPITQWRASRTLQSSAKLMLETIFLAFLGTAISLLISLPLSFLAARNLTSQMPGGWGLYSLTRSAFNILRSVEVLIIAVIMAIIVGIGPLAGVLALAIHGVGALGKLYSEAIESIEHGPIEAVMSTGANWMQVVRFGAVPQVVPQFISFTMYRWDINVRMATVIGLVGGGGIGNLLMSYINSLQWERAATAIWLIAVVVMLMDYASAVIRERVV